MSFQPLVPFAGYAGWTFLNRTLPTQSAAFDASPAISRDREYFRENIGNITSAEDLTKDFRLLRVALGAFGLQDDLPNRAFIQRVLSDGVSSDEALSNKLADKRYRSFSEAFGFGEALPPKTQTPGFADRILANFSRQEFERAIGDQNADMRLALSAARELPELVQASETDNGAWFRVMGNPPLRSVMETALGLPSSIGSLDLDQQLKEFRSQAERVFGDGEVAQFASEDGTEMLVQAFLTRSQLNALPSSASSASIALQLLGGG